jgi:hypothetical protein
MNISPDFDDFRHGAMIRKETRREAEPIKAG